MFDNFLALYGTYLIPMWEYVMQHVVLLAFVATVPILLWSIWRS